MDRQLLYAGVLLALAPGPLFAQVGTIGPGRECSSAITPGLVCTPGSECTTVHGAAGTCVPVPIEGGTRVGVCVGLAEEICCLNGELDCPTDRAPVMTGAACLCALPSFVYCDSSDPAALADCHRPQAGADLGSYLLGDCDLDGVPNGVEITLDTDVCEAPVIGAWTPMTGGNTSCVSPLETCSTPLAECPSPGVARAQCRVSPNGPVCVPEPGVFCCGGLAGLECPLDGQSCVVPEDVLDGQGFCTRAELCGRTREAIIACFTGSSGAFPVPFESGDCDRDGNRNDDEIEAGVDHCTAGPPLDAGSSMDGGAASTPARFGGGGGCVCGVARGRSLPAWLACLLPSVGLARLRRRRGSIGAGSGRGP